MVQRLLITSKHFGCPLQLPVPLLIWLHNLASGWQGRKMPQKPLQYRRHRSLSSMAVWCQTCHGETSSSDHVPGAKAFQQLDGSFWVRLACWILFDHYCLVVSCGVFWSPSCPIPSHLFNLPLGCGFNLARAVAGAARPHASIEAPQAETWQNGGLKTTY